MNIREPYHDYVHAKLWCSILVDANGPDHRSFFDRPMNENRGYAKTNMIRAGYLGTPNAFEVHRIMFVFSRAAPKDHLWHVAENTVWHFWIGMKIYHSAQMISMPQMRAEGSPIWICEHCSSVYCNQIRCPGCGSGNRKLNEFAGGDDIGVVFALELYKDMRLELLNEIQFRIALEGDIKPSHVPYQIWCYLEGIMQRGVQ